MCAIGAGETALESTGCSSRVRVRFPAFCNSSAKGADAIFWSLQAQRILGAQIKQAGKTDKGQTEN